MNDSIELLKKLEENLSHFQSNNQYKDTVNDTMETLISLLSLISNSEIENNDHIRRKILGFINNYEFGIINLFLSTLLISLEKFNNKSSFLITDILYFTYEKDTQLLDKIIKEYTNKINIVLRESNFESIDIDSENSKKMFSLIIGMLQSKIYGETSIEDETIMTIVFLSIANICCRQGNINRWEFYLLCDVAMHQFNRNFLHQKARNFSEEILQMSIEEQNPVYGYYVQLKCYIYQRNITESNLYLLLFIDQIDNSIPLKVIINVLKSLQRFFRDHSFFDLQAIIFNIINETYKDSLDERDFMQINYCNFLSNFKNNINISDNLIEFIKKNKELIIENGTQSTKIWLSLMIQLNEIYKNAQLKSYIDIFYETLPEAEINDLKHLLGDIDNNYYNKIINRLSETLKHRDMVSEIKNYTKIFTKFIERGLIEKNYRDLVNGFIMLSDRSLENSEVNDYPDFEEIHFHDNRIHDYYNENIRSFKNIDFSNKEILMITNINNHVVYMCSTYKKVKFSDLKTKWKLIDMINHLKNICRDMSFSTNEKNYEFEDHDYIDQLRIQLEQFRNYQIKTISCKPVGILYNNETSQFPSNLIQENNNFVFLDKPIYTLLNYNSLLTKKNISIDLNDIKLWSPIDTADIVLNKLYNSLHTIINKFKIKTFTGTQIEENLTSEISIIIAHGGSNIDLRNTLHATDSFAQITYEYSKIEKKVKKSKILLLFVCHSGKVSKDMFYERTNSIVRSFIQNDIEAVIAPKWPLNIEIIPVWLPVFIDSLNKGYSSLESFHIASKSVYSSFKNAGAWACLHYFGNPDIYIKNADKSGSQRFLSSSPHTTLQAGPHRAVHSIFKQTLSK